MKSRPTEPLVLNTTTLLALLREAANELDVLASYLDDPKVGLGWGMEVTAKAHKKLRDAIRLNLENTFTAADVQYQDLWEENFVLRCALRTRQSDENWRLRYLESEQQRRVAFIRGAKAMQEIAAQTAFEMRGVPDDTGRKIEAAILALQLPQDDE